MPIKFEDNIENNNTNYTVASALGNNIQGIYWVASTAARDLLGDSNTDNSDRRAQYVLVFVAGVPYVYTNASIADADWEDATNWSEVGEQVTQTVATTDLTDVDTTGVADGDFLVYDENGAGDDKWENRTAAQVQAVLNLDDLQAALGVGDGDANLGTFATTFYLTDNTTAKAGLEALDSAVNTLSGTVSDNTGDISQNTTDISTNAGSISTNASNISTNTSGVSTNASAISTVQGALSTNSTNITDLVTLTGVSVNNTTTGQNGNYTTDTTIDANLTELDTQAKANADAIAGISVPTNNNQLTNGAGYATSASLATVATSGDYDDLTNKPTIPTAFSGDYDDLTNKPTLFDGAYASLSGLPTLFSGSYTDLTNKPTLFSESYNDLSDLPTLFDGDYTSLTNLPTLFDGDYDSLTNLPTLFDGDYDSLTNKPTLVTSVDDLSDVDTSTTAPTSGQALVWDGTSKFVPGDVAAGEDTFTSGFTTNVTQGGLSSGTAIAAGDSVQDAVKSMLVTYLTPSLNLSGWSAATVEHGYSFSDSSFSISFTNSGNVDTGNTGSASFSDTYISNGSSTTITPTGNSQTVNFSRSGALLVTNANPAGNSGSLQRSSAAKLTVSGFANTNGGSISSKTSSSTVRYRYWVLAGTTRVDYGALSNTNGQALITDNATTSGGGIESGLIVSNGTMSFSGASVTSSEYVYMIYPNVTSVNQILNPSGSILYSGDTTGSTTTAIVYIGTFTMTNRYGKSVKMAVLRSKNPGAIGTGSYTVS